VLKKMRPFHARQEPHGIVPILEAVYHAEEFGTITGQLSERQAGE
jgi:hypothetical protein